LLALLGRELYPSNRAYGGCIPGAQYEPKAHVGQLVRAKLQEPRTISDFFVGLEGEDRKAWVTTLLWALLVDREEEPQSMAVQPLMSI
jgi:hypothetical protein